MGWVADEETSSDDEEEEEEDDAKAGLMLPLRMLTALLLVVRE